MFIFEGVGDAEHKHTIVDSDYKDLHSRYLQMDESIQSSENTSKAQIELKLQRTLLDDHHLNHKALQTEHQITLQTLKYSLYLNVGAQPLGIARHRDAYANPNSGVHWEPALRHAKRMKESGMRERSGQQAFLESLADRWVDQKPHEFIDHTLVWLLVTGVTATGWADLNLPGIGWSVPRCIGVSAHCRHTRHRSFSHCLGRRRVYGSGSDSDTGSQSQALREKLTDTRQSLKKAEIQWTEKGELQQLRNLEINCGGWQYFL
ncbi:hypothetical protein C8J57DRAFT_1257846 [Mycena rebaudengoi]|nr:hypothetical protein C8J57DRAFT_1257846 [Mycena rebaudengoi]